MGSDSDRRALLAIVLSLAVYYVWMTFVSPPPPPPVEAPAEVVDQQGEPPAEAPATPSAASEPAPTPAPPVADVPERRVSFAADGFSGEVESKTGGLRALALSEFTSPPVVTPWWIWAFDKITGRGAGGWEPYTGGDDPEEPLSAAGSFAMAGVGDSVSSGPCLLSEQGTGVVAKCMPAPGVVITKTFRPGEQPHTLDVEVTFSNATGQPLGDLWIGVADQMVGEAGRFDNVRHPVGVVDDSIENLTDATKVADAEVKEYEGPLSWFGVGDRYFMATLAPLDGGFSGLRFDDRPGELVGAFLVDPTPLDAGASRTYRFLGYVGPKQLDLLEPLGHDLDQAVEFGFFGFFARILLFLLKVFQHAVVNWGLSIMMLTLLVKLLFFPLTQKAFTSGKRMQALQPKLNEMKEKYKDNKELQTQETMKLFKEHNVNPLGGCLPSVIQIPVWFALYNVMLSSVELYDTGFLYMKDLTAVDPYGILPTIVAVLYFLQQRLTPMTGMDPQQQKIMRMLPLVFAFFMYSFPSGLVLYFSVNTTLTIAQQWWIYRSFDASQPNVA